MDSRERVLRVLNHEEADRVPFIDFPWDETLERWYNEGLPRGVSLHDYFGYDIYLIGPDASPSMTPSYWRRKISFKHTLIPGV